MRSFFATTFFLSYYIKKKRWRRKQHYQINHIKNISSSNYISFRIIHNITHKVDINEMKKRKKKKLCLSLFIYLCWHCIKHGLFSFRFINYDYNGERENELIDLWLLVHYAKQGFNIVMTQVLFRLISNFLFKVIIFQ